MAGLFLCAIVRTSSINEEVSGVTRFNFFASSFCLFFLLTIVLEKVSLALPILILSPLWTKSFLLHGVIA